MITLKKASERPVLAILLFIVSFPSVLAVLYTPALPTIVQKMGISEAQAQATLSVFLIGYAIGVLPYGPLSNCFGRKKALYAGAWIALFGACLAIMATALSCFWMLILGRFITAFGCSAGLKIAFTIIGDLYEKKEATKKTSAIILAFAIAPNLAIAIGGFLTQFFGWKSCFYFMSLYCCLILFLATRLPETYLEEN